MRECRLSPKDFNARCLVMVDAADLKRFKEFMTLLKDNEPLLDKWIRFLELAKEAGDKGAVVVPIEKPFLSRAEVRKVLHIGNYTIDKLIANGELTPLYVAESTAVKFRREQVLEVPKP